MHSHFTSIISRGFGRFASREFSPTIQGFINRSYVRLMGLDMSEFENANSYKTLNKLFTRALKTPREMPLDDNTLISGVDALISDFGTILDGKAYQIKGMSYNIERLFGENHKHCIDEVEGGEFANYYLSPKDYHRYHSPMDLDILSITHIPGKLYPVNFPLLRNKKDLFIENERVVMECMDSLKRKHILVLVGALNVGKMVISFEDSINTNSDIREPKHYEYKDLKLKRGEMFGWFEMGSTILTFSQKESIVTNLYVNQKVSFGDIVGMIKGE
ncbi:MAG: phosphatidylserine decarboxylase [Sulfurovum sp.]